MTVEHLSKISQPGKTEQWEQALGLLYINFRDYCKDALKNFDDEDIHQARVNSRKLLTLLSILDPGHSSGLYPLFKKSQKILGRVRDADVLIESFKKRRRQSKKDGDKRSAGLLKAVIKHQKEKRKKYRQKLARELPQLLGKELDEQWATFIGEQLKPLVAKRDANVVMRELEVAYEQKKKACKDIFREAKADSEEAFEALHDLRIAAKELRYTASAASFALNQKFHANEAIYKEVQEQLGEINDKRVWLNTLNSIGRAELDIGKKTWEAFTRTLRAEVLEALQQNEVVHIKGS
ncbi:CHAD domain-containing protein [Paenibacillus sp. BR2-3]|uniref:CHAD domain-containing protein n=1 Tax=Paenibacillus sp. BR2-3 TaxID=3048494 RepID=UPI003977A881